MRELEISVIDRGDVENIGHWSELHPELEIKQLIGCDFDLAEETIGLVEYTDGSYEVGIGEPLRPYIKVYRGWRKAEAYAAFWTTVQVRAMIGEPTEFEDEDGPDTWERTVGENPEVR